MGVRETEMDRQIAMKEILGWEMIMEDDVRKRDREVWTTRL